MATDPADPDLKLGELIPRPLDARVICITLLTAVVLSGSHYGGHIAKSLGWISTLAGLCGVEDAGEQLRRLFKAGPGNPRAKLWQLHYWAGAHTVLYFVIPALVVKLGFRENLRDYGLKIRGWYRRLWVYGAAFAVVLPLVLLFRGTPGFQRTYPFYKQAYVSWTDFWGWELAYIVQFFALEFFFRGFLVHGLKHRFGYYSVFVMTVPYCMIHFGKPLPETIGAIFAGVFLGTLSLWTRSIWLGVMIHVSVALAMDLAAMQYRGQLTTLWNS